MPSSYSGQNFAGVFVIDRPKDVVSGQKFTAVVKRLSAQHTKPIAPPPSVPQIAFAAAGVSDTSSSASSISNWRYKTGFFALTIPVERPAQILPREKDILAISKWSLSFMERKIDGIQFFNDSFPIYPAK